MEELWKNFDKIYCINLKEREDKYKYARETFERLDIPVEFYRVDKHKSDGAQGCFESHINLIKKAWDSGCENVLIFEDDIYPNQITFEKLKEVVGFIRNEDWDIFYLGICPFFFSIPVKKQNYKNIYRLKSNCTHAYIMNREYMGKVKDLTFRGTPMDTFYSKNTKKTYGIFPSLFYQASFSSDISNQAIEKFKESFFHKYKPFWLNLVEYTSMNKAEILAAISLILFLVLFLIFWKKNKRREFRPLI